MKHIQLFEGFLIERTDNTEKAKKVMEVATPEQKKVLDDFQAGTEWFFFNHLNGEITEKTIDEVLQLMVNEVEGDESQLEPEHIKYAKERKWLDESLTEPDMDDVNEKKKKKKKKRASSNRYGYGGSRVMMFDPYFYGLGLGRGFGPGGGNVNVNVSASGSGNATTTSSSGGGTTTTT